MSQEYTLKEVEKAARDLRNKQTGEYSSTDNAMEEGADILEAYAAAIRQQAARVDEGGVRSLLRGCAQFIRNAIEADPDAYGPDGELLAALEAALSAQPAERQGEDSLYVEARQCEDCDHLGMNDCSDTHSACGDCEWQGPTPDEDKCPGCGHENCMAVACPECGGRYRFLADRRLTHAAAPVGVPDGMVLVPRIPTDEMQDAFQEEQCRWSAITHVDDEAVEALWVAMLAAAAPVGVPDGMVLREVVEVAQGDLHMLKKAIEARDPWPELLFRVTDTERDLRTALAAAPSAPQGVER